MSTGDPNDNLILCNINGRTIVTTPEHCESLGGSPDIAQPPGDVELITCRVNGQDILTRPEDCDGLGGETV